MQGLSRHCRSEEAAQAVAGPTASSSNCHRPRSTPLASPAMMQPAVLAMLHQQQGPTVPAAPPTQRVLTGPLRHPGRQQPRRDLAAALVAAATAAALGPASILSAHPSALEGACLGWASRRPSLATARPHQQASWLRGFSTEACGRWCKVQQPAISDRPQTPAAPCLVPALGRRQALDWVATTATGPLSTAQNQ